MESYYSLPEQAMYLLSQQKQTAKHLEIAFMSAGYCFKRSDYFIKYTLTKDEQVLLFCIAIQYWSPGIGIAILLWKTSNTQAIPEKFVWSKHVHVHR